MGRAELVGWIATGVVLCAFAIPWFLWGNDTVVAGLPVWVWWHIGWMILTAVVFWIFTKRAWGIGIETEGSASRGGTDAATSRTEATASPSRDDQGGWK